MAVPAIRRRETRRIHVGSVPVGGGSPVTVQSMTNTLTADVAATVAQVLALEAAGADIVRISCPDADSTAALAKIIPQVHVPIVADIHFHYRQGIEAAEAGAACLRINPGNMGSEKAVHEVVAAAKAHGCSIRIGVNGGSLEKRLLEKYGEPCAEAMVESALEQAKMLEDADFFETKISVKASHTRMTVEAYRQLSAACDYPLHLGVTETGGLIPGTVRSAIGIGSLLNEGIGDTLRVSLTADPVEEIRVGFEILKALGIRSHGLNVVSCPTCARKGYDVIGVMTALEKRLANLPKPLTVAVMGCVVNGPGEAAHADLAVTGGGGGRHALYRQGKLIGTVTEAEMVETLAAMAEEMVRNG